MWNTYDGIYAQAVHADTHMSRAVTKLALSCHTRLCTLLRGLIVDRI